MAALRNRFDDSAPFAAELSGFMDRARWSRRRLAIAAGVDASYLTRIALGERAPPRREIVDALADALSLSADEHDRLLVAAGYVPTVLARLGCWPSTLQAVAAVLADGTLSESERQTFAATVTAIAERWRPR